MPSIPNPPLRYWPCPPSNEGIFELDLSSCSNSNRSRSDDAAGLAQRLEDLTQLQQQVANHYGRVVQWTEQCHAESELHPLSNEKEWLGFVLKIKDYLTRHVAQRNRDIELAIERINMQQLTVIRQDLLARLERLEREHDKVQAKRRKLTGELISEGLL